MLGEANQDNSPSPPTLSHQGRGEKRCPLHGEIKEPNEWPVERTARLAVSQTDGVLSDINFGEVFPFVAKPLTRDGLARYIGPVLGGQVAGLSRSDPLV